MAREEEPLSLKMAKEKEILEPTTMKIQAEVRGKKGNNGGNTKPLIIINKDHQCNYVNMITMTSPEVGSEEIN